MKETLKRLLSLVPSEPEWRIDWVEIENMSELSPFWEKMKNTIQNPVWHGEGDVMTHTRMVCEALVGLHEFRQLERIVGQEVFLATLFHDIGKIPCTRLKNGVWTSPNHTLVGAKMARRLLWETFGMCGTKELQQMREIICNLIRYHSMPPHVMERSHPERKLIQVAAEGALVRGFSIRLLCLLEKADMLGRISKSMPDSLERIQRCESLAEEVGCLDGPLPFPSPYSRFVYLSGRKVSVEQELFDHTWGEVILMSGLPGTGKDTYIKKNFGNLPVISLDEIRKELNVLPANPQGSVINAARERAKEYLQKKQSFVWDATNLSPVIREKQLSLFYSYHASVRIIFLETEWQEMLRRNKNRQTVVPEHMIRKMLSDLVPPTMKEAPIVEWVCV